MLPAANYYVPFDNRIIISIAPFITKLERPNYNSLIIKINNKKRDFSLPNSTCIHMDHKINDTIAGLNFSVSFLVKRSLIVISPAELVQVCDGYEHIDGEQTIVFRYDDE